MNKEKRYDASLIKGSMVIWTFFEMSRALRDAPTSSGLLRDAAHFRVPEEPEGRLEGRGNTLLTIFLTSFNHFLRSSWALVATMLKVRRWNAGTPQRPKTQFFQMVSRGSPNTFDSRSGAVFDVLKTIAALALSKPAGTPSPLSPSRNL